MRIWARKRLEFSGLTRVFGAHNGILEQRVEIFAQMTSISGWFLLQRIFTAQISGRFTKRCYITLCYAFSGKFLKVLFVITSCRLKYRENKQNERAKNDKDRKKTRDQRQGWFSSTCTVLLPLGMSIWLTDLQVTVKAKHSV